ncbi:MAG: tRNA (adenosine(37)-N6)-threonylcarbamoyltransferase complex ATPase subunit type 1 TsaE [Clostridia bacterium]|nr:tRNA (adenosine(37)-N6)-threonylcarbamoyltransferase complex ATPase subunit type 1 TsaE [Clostridia bacterium]
MTKTSRLITSKSTDQTAVVARRLGRHAPPGTVIAAYGELGTGKTCFAAGLARGLGIEDSVNSPTYVIFRIYPGEPPLAHIDAYRLEGLPEEEIALTGIEDCFAAANVSYVEWPGYIEPWLPEDTIKIYFSLGAGQHERLLEIIYDREKQGWIDEAFSY